MMKIAFVVQRYGLEVNGGAEMHCRIVAERLTPYCEVDVITTCAIDYISWKNEYRPGDEVLNGVRVIRFPVDFERNIRKFNKKSESVFRGASYQEEIEWMKMQGPYSSQLIEYLSSHQEEYDSIIFFTYLYATTFFGIRRVQNRALLVPTAHDEPPIYLSIFREVFTSPKYFLNNTSEERSFTQKLFQNSAIPSVVVGVGVDGPETVHPDNFFRLHNIRDFILYVGRIDPSKGCSELFDHFIRFKNEHRSDLKLVLIGKAVMKVPIHQDIVPLGFLETQEKYDAIAASRLLIMPSPFESLSMVLLESWYCKRPVLVNGVCEVLEAQCRRSNGGLWYTSYEEFEACLSWFLDHEETAARLGESGFRYVHENYSWESIIKKYLEAITLVRTQIQ